jgi:hypothetical protein
MAVGKRLLGTESVTEYTGEVYPETDVVNVIGVPGVVLDADNPVILADGGALTVIACVTDAEFPWLSRAVSVNV